MSRALAKKQVCGSEGTVVGRAGTLLLCASAINQFFKERCQNKNSFNLFPLFWAVVALHITARQYGEVVLPDDSTGQSPGTLAKKLSRCKEGMAHFLPSWYKFN
jgi:hypothetical protein